MRAAARWLAALFMGPLDPHRCLQCRVVSPRPTGEQRTQIANGTEPTCPWCGGPVWSIAALDRLFEDLTSRTAAPGWNPEAAAMTNDCKESMDVHTLLSEKTPRGRQLTAALALAHLLEQDLPDAEWRITADGRLYGHINLPGRDADARMSVHAYAGFLGNKGVDRSQGHNDHAEWLRLCTSASYRGTPVSVWTHVAVRTTNPYGGAA